MHQVRCTKFSSYKGNLVLRMLIRKPYGFFAQLFLSQDKGPFKLSVTVNAAMSHVTFLKICFLVKCFLPDVT